MKFYAAAPGAGINRDVLIALGYGAIVSPDEERHARKWTENLVLDNGAWSCHVHGREFNFERFEGFAKRWVDRAEWIIAPDVVGDWSATVELAKEWIPKLHSIGYSKVLVAVQNGATAEDVLALDADGIALGGTTDWKESSILDPQWRIFELRHVLRVNTRRRLVLCMFAGWSSVDGSGASKFLSYAVRFERWVREIELEIKNSQFKLFEA